MLIRYGSNNTATKPLHTLPAGQIASAGLQHYHTTQNCCGRRGYQTLLSILYRLNIREALQNKPPGGANINKLSKQALQLYPYKDGTSVKQGVPEYITLHHRYPGQQSSNNDAIIPQPWKAAAPKHAVMPHKTVKQNLLHAVSYAAAQQRITVGQ